jgi:hypothetical protein
MIVASASNDVAAYKADTFFSGVIGGALAAFRWARQAILPTTRKRTDAAVTEFW